MSDIAIAVEGVSKLYRIGVAAKRHESFTGAIASVVTAPVRNFRRLSGLNTYKQNGAAEGDDLLWALRDVSFEVKRGEALGVIGRNGAGKSTLLKLLSRITEPTSGRIRLRGRVSSLLEVGTGFHPELTGRENIYLNGTILGMRKREIDRKFDEIVEFSGISRFLDTPVKRYSSGMTVRLAFSVAAHLESEILIIDEVLAVGDVEFQNKCMGKMQEVASSANGTRTVLFVSHNMTALSRLCPRSILMERGRLTKSGTTQELIRSYLTNGDSQDLSQAVFADEPGRSAQYLRVSILNQNEECAYEHTCDDPITVRLECVVRSVTAGTYLTCSLLNHEGVRVLFSDSRDTIPDLGAMLQPGFHRFDVEVPKRLLAPGTYSINIGIASALSGAIDNRQACAGFSLIDTSSQRATRPGVLSVRLPWEHLQAETANGHIGVPS